MKGCAPEDPSNGAQDCQVVEFEVEARTTVLETWRVPLVGCGDLEDDDEVADRVEAQLAAGKARFVARVADQDRTRVVRRESVLRL
jgi:hypothetical protein